MREINSTKLLRQSQALVNFFWKRFAKEYIPSLIERKKWKEKRKNLKEADVALVAEPNQPRGIWNLGRIVSTHPGQDGVVRAVRVRTQYGSTKTNHKTVFLKGSGDLQSSSYWLGQLGCFLPSQCWFVPVGITEAKNSTLGEKEHNVLWLLHRVSQLNVTRIVGLQTVNCLDFVSRLAAGMYVRFRFWAQS